MDDYLKLRRWLAGELGQMFEETAAPLREKPVLGLDHNRMGPYAAAVLRIGLEEEWWALRAAIYDRPTATAAEDALYDAVLDRMNDGANWNMELEDLGRTRSLVTDAWAIRAGKPEAGIYYWY